MVKSVYVKPVTEVVYIDADELLQTPGASQFDNDGDGNTDQRPVIIGDPDGGIGAKRHGDWSAWDTWDED